MNLNIIKQIRSCTQQKFAARLTLLTVITALSSCGSRTSALDCSKYRTGNFIYKIPGGNGQAVLKITRYDTIQKEVLTNTGDTGILSVKWIDSCSYVMKFLEIISDEPDSLTSFIKSMTIKTVIIGGNQEYYLFESSNDKNDYRLKDTIWVYK